MGQGRRSTGAGAFVDRAGPDRHGRFRQAARCETGYLSLHHPSRSSVGIHRGRDRIEGKGAAGRLRHLQGRQARRPHRPLGPG